MNPVIPDIGDDVPPIHLKTAMETDIDLATVLKSGINVMLLFYRGHW